jgi:hypothetical protein
VLADRSGVLVGHYAAFAPRSDPAYALVGLGDCVVAVSERRRGIAVTMARHLIPACEERGAQALISSTEIPAGLIANDFHPVTDFSYYWEQDGACHRHPNWWSKELRGAPSRPVRLIDNDF